VRAYELHRALHFRAGRLEAAVDVLREEAVALAGTQQGAILAGAAWRTHVRYDRCCRAAARARLLAIRRGEIAL
jgi:hypothetical protein